VAVAARDQAITEFGFESEDLRGADLRSEELPANQLRLISRGGTTTRPDSNANRATLPWCGSPSSHTVSGFPRYQASVTLLPRTEQQKMRRIAGLILRSFRPGCKPLDRVQLVGHADRDVRRGQGFEKQVSVQRALAVQRSLINILRNTTIGSRIVWQPRGVGASALVMPTPRTEAERARNRRVDILLSGRGAPPIRNDVARAVLENRRYRRSLGWQAYEFAIMRLLGFASSIPSEPAFASAVARWQAQRGLPSNGVITSPTLAQLVAALKSVQSFAGDDTRPTVSMREIPTDSSALRQLQREFQYEAGEEADKFVTEQAFGIPQGHQRLTHLAAAGLPISPSDLTALKDGNARVDALTKAFDAPEQRRHTLRRTKCQPVSDALSEARNHLIRLHSLALAAPNRQIQFELLGEALHLIQDSYSNAHTERRWGGLGGFHPIVFIRFFGFQGSCAFPLEHRVIPPPDPRDTISAGGTLTAWARESVSASRDYLNMALRHVSAPGSPVVPAELRTFADRHLALDPAHTPTTFCYPGCPDPAAPCRCP
jgi:hypothetical protein